MSQAETMRLVAEVVDRYSIPMKEMQKAVRDLAKGSKAANEEAGKATREHSKHLRELHERFSKTKEFVSGSFTPALATLGITSFGVGAGFGKLAEQIKAAAEKYEVFNSTMRRGHVSGQFLQGLSTGFQAMGIEADKAFGAASKMGETIDRLRAGDPQEMWRLQGVFGNMLPSIQNAIKDTKSYEEAMTRIITIFDKAKTKGWQRRIFMDALTGVPELGEKTGKEIIEGLHRGAEAAAKHPLNLPLLKKLNEDYTELKIVQEGFWNELIETFGPGASSAIKSVTDAIETMGEKLKEIREGPQKLPDSKAPEGWLNWLDHSLGLGKTDNKLMDRLRLGLSLGVEKRDDKNALNLRDGMQPISWRQDDGVKTISRGTKEGVLDAFREWMAQRSLPGSNGNGTDGVTNAAYHPGGVGGRARFGNKEHPDLGGGEVPKSTQGTVDKINRGSGGDSIDPGAPVGSNAAKGIGGGINRDKWRAQLDANQALKERFFRHSLGENTHPTANQAVMEEAANRADIRRNNRFDDHGNLRYFQGYYRGQITPKMQKMLDDNYRKVFVEGSDVARGAIDNSSQGLAAGHERSGKFKGVASYGGDGIPGHRGVETFQVPGWGESGRGERARWPGWRHEQLEEAARRQAEAMERSGRGASLRDHIRRRGSLLKQGKQSGLFGPSGASGARDPLGHATVSVDFTNMPRGVRTKAAAEGVFKSVRLNRGRPMAMASDES